MKLSAAAGALGALAQDTRLAIFRFLVERGPEGLPAGRIALKFGLPPATLSFHLAQLKQAGLVGSRREGRSLIYAADFARMRALLGFLTEDCCGGRPEICLPVAARAPKRRRG